MSTKEVVLLGCGQKTGVDIVISPEDTRPINVTRLDMDSGCKPDIVFELCGGPLPFEDNSIDELHAYEVLEHLGKQGDWREFFKEFEGYWRVLKPGGYLIGTVPGAQSEWAWGDPGHTRVITLGTFSFLDRTRYGTPPMTDYRAYYHADFELVWFSTELDHTAFVLKTHKPVRA